MKFFYTLAVMLLLFANCLFSQTSTAPSSGDGSKSNPYQIATLNNLYWLSQQSSKWDKYFIQTADIDASDTKNWDSGKGFSPIGTNTTNFTGNYNGQEYVISNLYFNNNSYIGLFGWTNSATISNLGIVNLDMTGNNFIAGLIARGQSNTISYCYVTGQINSTGTFVGGLIGYGNYNTISYCYSNCDIYAEGKSYGIGGLIGYSHRGTISTCYATGIIEGYASCAGLIGIQSEGVYIYNCYANSNVTANNSRAGGLIGYSYTSSSNNSLSFINYCYAAGTVSCNKQSGAFIGYNVNTLNACYYNAETSGQSSGIGYNKNSTSATGLTTSEMKDADNFDLWNFSSNWSIQTDKTFPALIALDNAPFTFGESEYGSSSYFLENDYDYETLQQNLFLDVKSVVLLSDGVDYVNKLGQLSDGDSVKLVYRAAERRTNDTLYGNVVNDTIELVLPAFLTDTIDVTEDTKISGATKNLLTGAPDNSFTYSIIKKASNGTLSIVDEKYVYTPNENFYGLDSARIRVKGLLSYSTSWIYFFVSSVNDAPVLSEVSTIHGYEDISITLSMDDVTASDAEGDSIYLGLSNGDNYTYNGLTIYPSENFNGTLTVPVFVTDGIDSSNTINMSISVAAINDAPVIMSKVNTSATEGVLFADTVIAVDVENDALTYSLSYQPDGMVITNNIITWTPGEGTTTSGIVTLTVSDGTDAATQNFLVEVTSKSTYSSVTDINSLGDITLYPNPVSDNFIIDGFEGSATLYLFDITGTTVLTQVINAGERINADDLCKGLYVAKIKLADSVITKSFIKSK